MSQYQVKFRIFSFQIIIVSVFLIFVVQLWRLQILEGDQYQQLADRNRFRAVDINAPRGIIYDRNGELLVRNRPIFNVVLIPAFLPEDPTAQAQLFARLADLLQLPITNGGEREVPNHNAFYRSFMHHEYTRLPNRQVRNSRSRLLDRSPQGIRDAVYNAPIVAPYQPITIAEDVDPEIAAIIEEDRLNLPGVLIETGSQRDYLTGSLTSQILGYVGPISPERVADYPAPLYGPNDGVGLIGIEASYEQQLHGVKGLESIEVDVTGRKVQTIGEPTLAEPGRNLILTVDLELQKYVTEVLQATMDGVKSESGAAIVLNPQNGEILAMVSLPSYDNNLFASGISAREYSLLSQDENTPLVNKAVAGLYPPASTFKIVIASGALEVGSVTPEQTFFDAGTLYLPNKFFPDDPSLAQPFYCWLRQGHGLVNVISALAFSCDVYFYQVGGGYEPSGYAGLGLENLVRFSERFGYGSVSGVDIPGESAGLVPTSRWKRLNYAETWVTGDTYNMSIGQGFVLATPLQVLNSYAAIANGGTLYKPYLVKEIRNPQNEIIYQAQPEVVGTLDLSPETIALVQAGLAGVVDYGTTQEIIDVPGINVAGKTGTAEFCKQYPQCLDRDGRVQDKHAWFVAYAPRERPEVAVVVFVYDGGEGSQVAAPAVNQILRYYFGIERPEDTAASAAQESSAPVEAIFASRLLGADFLPGSGAAIHGFVLDSQGNGLADMAVDLLLEGEVVGQTRTGPNGQFDYNEVDARQRGNWQVRLADFPNSPSIQLTVTAGTRYFIEFQMTSVAENLTTEDGSG